MVKEKHILFSQFIANEREANKYGKSNFNSTMKYDNVMYSLNTYNYLSKNFLMINHGVKNSGVKIKKSITNPSFKKEHLINIEIKIKTAYLWCS